jgi:HAD superfamily hydrolase (TIGR01509 family)
MSAPLNFTSKSHCSGNSLFLPEHNLENLIIGIELSVDMGKQMRCVIFDLTNVLENLIEFEKEHLIWVGARVLEKTGYSCDHVEAVKRIKETLKFFLDLGTEPFIYHYTFWKEALQRSNIIPNLSMIIKTYNMFLDEYCRVINIYPDAISTLRSLKKDFTLALVSNSNMKRCYRFVEKFELTEYFSMIVASGEIGFMKPQPAIFRYLIKKLDLQPNECAMVGDRLDTDISGVKELGMVGILLVRPEFNKNKPQLKVEPDFQITSLEELVTNKSILYG